MFVRSQPLRHQGVRLKMHRTQLSLELGAVSQHAIVGALFVHLWETHDRSPHRPVVVERLLIEIVEECT